MRVRAQALVCARVRPSVRTLTARQVRMSGGRISANERVSVFTSRRRQSDAPAAGSGAAVALRSGADGTFEGVSADENVDGAFGVLQSQARASGRMCTRRRACRVACVRTLVSV